MKNIQRIRYILFFLTCILVFSACKVQQPSYVGLYMVDNPTEVRSPTLDIIEINAVDTVQVGEEIISSLEKVNRDENEAYSDQSKNNILINAEYVNIFSDAVNHSTDIIQEIKNQKSIPTDTVYIEKEVVKTVSDYSQTNIETSSIITAQKDSIQQLKKQVNELKNQKSIPADTVYVEKVNTEILKTDTISFTVFYELGAIVPISVDSILYLIKNTIKSKNLTTIIISGYTDISGNSGFNKALTQKRIDYFISELKDYISLKQLLTQNFGDYYASKILKDSERKLVFTIIFQKK